jgi:hypothetical protein
MLLQTQSIDNKQLIDQSSYEKAISSAVTKPGMEAILSLPETEEMLDLL